jgi:hypothetical protein
MKQPKWVFYAVVALAAGIGGLLGGFSMHWSHQPVFPLYGYTLDLIGLPVVIGLILYARQLRSRTTDEFAITKKRYAVTTAFFAGVILYMLSGMFHFILPQVYHAFVASLGTPEDAYDVGRFMGFAPFVAGMVIGQIVAWLKYR